MTWLWLIAGPNGSGKTTLLRRGFLQAAIPGLPQASLNADAVTALLVAAGVERDTANLGAAQLIDDMLAQTVARCRPVLVETVLSSSKYLPVVQAARDAQVRIGLVFVTLRAGIDHVLRVRGRVAMGGHDVAADKVLARRERAHANLWRLAARTDLALLFDNSQIAQPVLVATCSAGRWSLLAPERLPDLEPELRLRAGA